MKKIVLFLLALMALAAVPAIAQESTPEITYIPAGYFWPEGGVQSNEEWVPFYKTFNDIPYTLVPPGCYETIRGFSEEATQQGASQVKCLSTPYWAQVTEVSNGQFGTVSDDPITTECRLLKFRDPEDPQYVSSAEGNPVTCVTKAGAESYCGLQGGRLPTLEEWEYAARGPDSLIYPWGKDWVDGIAHINSGLEGIDTLPVNSLPEGASWVGAVNMLGNVSEIVSPHLDHSDETWVKGWSRDEVLETIQRPGENGGLEAVGVLPPDFMFNFTGFRCVRDFNAEELIEVTSEPSAVTLQTSIWDKVVFRGIFRDPPWNN